MYQSASTFPSIQSSDLLTAQILAVRILALLKLAEGRQ